MMIEKLHQRIMALFHNLINVVFSIADGCAVDICNGNLFDGLQNVNFANGFKLTDGHQKPPVFMVKYFIKQNLLQVVLFTEKACQESESP